VVVALAATEGVGGAVVVVLLGDWWVVVCPHTCLDSVEGTSSSSIASKAAYEFLEGEANDGGGNGELLLFLRSVGGEGFFLSSLYIREGFL
jgi:hypothetical protein